MSAVTDLHAAVRQGSLQALSALLEVEPRLANARSESDTRGTYPLHVAAEFGHAEAAKLLLEHGADVSLRDAENDAIPLSWAAFFGRPAARVANGSGSRTLHWTTGGNAPSCCGRLIVG